MNRTSRQAMSFVGGGCDRQEGKLFHSSPALHFAAGGSHWATENSRALRTTETVIKIRHRPEQRREGSEQGGRGWRRSWWGKWMRATRENKNSKWKGRVSTHLSFLSFTYIKLKYSQSGTVVHTYNPCSLGGRGKFQASPVNLARPHLQIKTRKFWGCSSVWIPWV